MLNTCIFAACYTVSVSYYCNSITVIPLQATVLIADNKSRIVNHDITNRKFYESPTPYFKLISVNVILVFVTPLQAGRPKNVAIELVLLDIYLIQSGSRRKFALFSMFFKIVLTLRQS